MIRMCVEAPILAKPHSRATAFLDPMERPISRREKLGREPKQTGGTRNANPILEQVTGSESDTDRASRETRNKNATKQYEAAEEKRINEEKRKFNGMRQTEADKKLRSILFLALGSEGKRVFTQKNPRVKILAISLTQFWTLLDAAFNKPPNTTSRGINY